MEINDREIVLPGQFLGTDIICDDNCIRAAGKFYSTRFGIARVDGKNVSIMPSSGAYVPKVNDVIIGVVKTVLTGRWAIDMNSPYQCTMFGEAVTRRPLEEDLTRFYNVGDILSGKITSVNEVHESLIEGPFKLEGGLIVEVNPRRIPRVIGRKRSMLNMIREKTNSRMVVGQNGYVWIKGENAAYVASVVKKIEAEAQSSGLTDRISRLLDER
ncbi:MAG: KH domain-containing protein [Candidatus Altiarchaeota archaeon]